MLRGDIEDSRRTEEAGPFARIRFVEKKQILMATNQNVSFSNSTGIPQAKIIVRTEEVVIVTLVLVLWIAAIALFFNRWGKIRMLEPYQPKFIQQHRPSCPLVDPVQESGEILMTNEALQTAPDPSQPRSYSKFSIINDTCQEYHLRPRQNSVFVGSSIVTLPMNPPRKVKSAFDLQNLILSDTDLNRSTIKLNLTGGNLRRSSLRTTLNVYSDSQTDTSPIRNAESGRRLSFKDLVEESTHLVQCNIEREPTEGELNKAAKKLGEARQNKSIPSQSSVSESRHNSISFQDVKLNVQDRRGSLFPTQKDGDDTRSGVSTFRRNSAMFINSLDADRNYLLPRYENRSGVVDFRRNSMLIINNLNEDIGIRSFGRNMSLGGSNMNLDFPAPRRSSVIPPFCHEHKPKTAKTHVPIVKAKSSFTNSKSPSLTYKNETKFLASHKASKSLDSSESTKITWKYVKREASPEPKCKFLAPANKVIGSTSSLVTERDLAEEKKLCDESRSTGNLSNRTEINSPRIVVPETDNVVETSSGRTNLSKTEDEWKSVKLTSSLSNINISSAIPLNVITTSGGNKKTSPIEISHV